MSPFPRSARLALLLLIGCAVPAGAEPPASVAVRWLGVAGVSISDGDAVLLHDPFFSRPGLWRTLFEYYEPDVPLLERLVAAGSPAPELASADWILIGHAHYDHLGDAPWLAQRSGALLAGSQTAVNLAQGYGLAAERTRRVAPGDVFDAGPFEVRVVESRHAKVALGRVPFEGEVSTPPRGPVRRWRPTCRISPMMEAGGVMSGRMPGGIGTVAIRSMTTCRAYRMSVFQLNST